MIQYILEFSKYFNSIFVLLYTLECFLVFRHKDEKARRLTYRNQIVLIVLFHFFSFLSICIKTGKIDYLFYYGVFQVIVLSIIEILPMIYPKINRLLINNSCMLISIGLIILVRLDLRSAIKQLIIMGLSFFIASFFPLLMKKIGRIPNWPYLYGALGIVLLLGVYIFGSVTNGSKLSVSVFGISFQASEFVKISFVLFVAGALYIDTSLKNIAFTSILAAIHVFLLFLSRDLGAALILFVLYVLLLYIASKKYIYLIAGAVSGLAAAIISYKLFRHVKVRVMAFLDPFSVIDNEGYQITQSLFAIGSGSWFGLGLFEGTPETIPYVETDFIFSAIAQEMGIIVAICLILISLSCFIMFINISFQFNNNFYRLIATGFGLTYVFQVFMTVGGGTKFIPLSGVTFPLVSYGGSSIMATIFTFFIIEGLYVIRDKKSVTVKPDYKKQNKIVLIIMYVFVSLFALLSIYLCIYVSTHKVEFINNAYNPRQEVLIKKTTRGSIYTRNYELLATTNIDKASKNETRFYPMHNIFSHVIGYASNGKSGIEGQANYYLINSSQSFSDKVSSDLSNEKYPGDSVITTLDMNLQKVAYTAIGGYNGAVVVSNPKTGEILALVSKPDYDPNDIDTIWDDLIENTESSVLFNRATQGLYPPGSTFKILTLLEYIRENPNTYSDYSYYCSGELDVDDGKIICYNHTKHGNVNLIKSLAVSCNSSFGNIGLDLDKNKFQNTLDNLLFNSNLPLMMNYSVSSIDVKNEKSDIEVVRTAFGQGNTLMTPMHLNLITSAIANDGVLMKPYTISKVVNNNFIDIVNFKPEKYDTLLSKEEAQILKEYMSEVVNSGTAKKLKNDVYQVAGKTGSAEFSDFTNITHSWFTGFAPVDDPQICVTIILENCGTSGTHAVPMAKKIFDEYFRSKETSDNNVFLTEE